MKLMKLPDLKMARQYKGIILFFGPLEEVTHKYRCIRIAGFVDSSC
jgi:hypothetical protein